MYERLQKVSAVLVAVIAVSALAAWRVRPVLHAAPQFCGEAGIVSSAAPQPTPRLALDAFMRTGAAGKHPDLSGWRELPHAACGPTFVKAGQPSYSADKEPGGWLIEGVDLEGNGG